MKATIINKKRLDECLKKISNVFVEEEMSPFEVKILLDVISNNVDKLDDIYTKAQLRNAILGSQEPVKEEPPILGVS